MKLVFVHQMPKPLYRRKCTRISSGLHILRKQNAWRISHLDRWIGGLVDTVLFPYFAGILFFLITAMSSSYKEPLFCQYTLFTLYPCGISVRFDCVALMELFSYDFLLSSMYKPLMAKFSFRSCVRLPAAIREERKPTRARIFKQ